MRRLPFFFIIGWKAVDIRKICKIITAGGRNRETPGREKSLTMPLIFSILFRQRWGLRSGALRRGAGHRMPSGGSAPPF